MKVDIVQTNTVWHDVAANLFNVNKIISKISPDTDVVVLPEMFNTGFTMKPELVNPEDTETTIATVKNWSKLLDAVFCGSIIRKVNSDFFNSFFWVEPSGKTSFYDKRHLFNMAGEGNHYKAGNQRRLVEWQDFTFLPQVCYDLRFPVFSRNRGDYDCLIYVANWPAPRINAWRTLLQARAIENQCFVVGVNRVGEDPNGNEYSGQSLVIDYAGQIMVDVGNEVKVESAYLDINAMHTFREKLPFLKDRDNFTLHF